VRQQEYAGLTATQLVALVAKGEVTPTEVTRAALERIALLDGDLHAFCTLDADGARTTATAARAGTAEGPLQGVPFAVKDLLATAGLLAPNHPSAAANLLVPCIRGHSLRAAAVGVRLWACGNTSDSQSATAH